MHGKQRPIHPGIQSISGDDIDLICPDYSDFVTKTVKGEKDEDRDVIEIEWHWTATYQSLRQ